ncbi:MAG: CRTAC1 family protein [Bryobacterales bacterium]|nr:CRTAC1 family protein [Bryobacterales bacterium]
MALSGLWQIALAAAAVFTDAAPKSTFSYVTDNGYRPGARKLFPQPLCGGVAALDFDNDGLVDLFFTNGPGARNALLRNLGGGRFADVTARAGFGAPNAGYALGAAAADFDNDGFTDLFIARDDANSLYRNRGDGTFEDVSATAGLAKPAGTLSVQGAWIDYDRDGRLDLVVSNYTLWTRETDRRCVREDGVDFYCHPKTYPAVPHRLYRNLGGARFADVTEAAGLARAAGKGMGIAIADVNGDAWPDIFIANDTERNFLFVNRAGAGFEERGLALGVAYNDDAATVSAMGADLRDYDNDGWPDLFYNDLAGQVWGLFRNLTGRTFRYLSPAAGLAAASAPFAGWGGGFLDYDNDGWRDLYSANGDVDMLKPTSEQHDTLFRNEGGRRFVDVSAQAGEHFARRGYQRGAAFADFNNDGALDIAVTSLGRRPAILLNGGPAAAHWLALHLTGVKSNRDAIGAYVKVTLPSGRVLHDWVSPSVGFLSSSDKRVHFGLGAETHAARVEIRWPSGAVTQLRQVRGPVAAREEN